EEGCTKIERDRLSTDRAEALRVLHGRDAGNERDENKGNDQHPDHPDEKIADPLDLIRCLPKHKTGEGAENHSRQNPLPQDDGKPAASVRTDHGQVLGGGWRSRARPERTSVGRPFSMAKLPLMMR